MPRDSVARAAKDDPIQALSPKPSTQSHPVPQNPQPHLARFFGMELHARDLPALNDGRERLAMLCRGHRVGGDWRNEAVSEVDLRSRRDAFNDGSVAPEVERVPADVRDLHAAAVFHRLPLSMAE